jgi:hypothetical protein
MNTVKKFVLATVAIGFLALSSCEKHTCPTYSKAAETKTNSARV